MGKKRDDVGPTHSGIPAKKVIKKQQQSISVSQNWAKLQPTLPKRTQPRKPEAKKELGSLPEPSSSDSSVTKVVGIDCEMVGIGSDGKKSALARVSIVNSYGNVLYDAYVKPVEYVTDFRTHISGIRYADIKDGENFEHVQKKVSDLISGRILVGHALKNDLKALLLSHPKSNLRDTSADLGRARSLQHLAELHLGASIQRGAHSSVEDARAAMMLYTKFRDAWEKTLKQKNKFS